MRFKVPGGSKEFVSGSKCSVHCSKPYSYYCTFNMDSKLLDKFIVMFHKNVKHFKHSHYMLYNIDIEHFEGII